MVWQPQSAPLDQLAQCLCDSLNGRDLAKQKNAEQMLQQARTSPDINNYLVYLNVNPQPVANLNEKTYHEARCAASIMLKNNIKNDYRSLTDESRDYVKLHILAGLQDVKQQIRNHTGNVVTEMVRQGGIIAWPDILVRLVAMIEHDQGSLLDAQDGAMSAIVKICEDNRRALDHEYQDSRPLAYLLPKLIDFTQDSNPKVRARATSAINVFLRDPVALTVREHINEILPEIIKLTQDDNDDVRRYVCRAFALLADSLPQVLVPCVGGIVDYTVVQQRDQENPELALDAAEFFFESTNKPQLLETLGPFLPKIVPVLLESMIYSEDDQLRVEAEDDEDADVEDEDKDIKPQFAASKQGRATNTATQTSQSEEKSAGNGYAYVDSDDLSDGEIDDDEDGEIDPEEEWNLRKCSAASLDALAVRYQGAVFTVTLPWLVDNLKHKDWPNREAAVLTLGAIAPGCTEAIQPHLPELIPYLLTLLGDEQSVVRQITCWSLGRYLAWAASLPDRTQFFEPIMEGMLRCMLDNNKTVQKSAASAFGNLEETANSHLAPYCNVILQQFAKCFRKYKDKNIYILYDCVQTLAEHAGTALAEPENVDLLMPALIERWQKVQDRSREIFPLLECLCFVATALGPAFGPFAEPLFNRCIKLIQSNLEDTMIASAGEQYHDAPDKDFLVTSLDLLSSLIQALDESQSSKLVIAAQPNMFELLAYCMRDANNDVRQSAYALLGDCAIYIFPTLQPFLPPLLDILILQLDLSEVTHDPETASRVINNACWSAGEIAMRYHPTPPPPTTSTTTSTTPTPYAPRLLSPLAVIMFSKDVPESLSENATVAIGRLGLSAPAQIAPHLASIAPRFLQLMRGIQWTEEKAHAYKGFARVVLENPAALEQCLLDFLVEIADAPVELVGGMGEDGPGLEFGRVCERYREMVGAGWEGFVSGLGEKREVLRRDYSV